MTLPRSHLRLFMLGAAAGVVGLALLHGTSPDTCQQGQYLTIDDRVRPNATAIATLTLEELPAQYPEDQLPGQVGTGYQDQIITDLRILNDSQVPGPQLPLVGDTDDLTVAPYQPTRFTPPALPSREEYTTAGVLERLPDTSPGTIAVQDAADDELVDSDILTVMRAGQDRDEPVAIRVRDGAYTLGMVHDALDDPALLQQDGDRFTATAPILVGGNASLIIRDRTLDLMTTSGTFLLSRGQLFIVDSTVRSWNGTGTSPGLESKRRLDATDFFRPFIWGAGGSTTFIAGSTISHLGFRDAGSYGVTFTSDEDTPPAGGWIVDSTVRNNHYGFYSDHARNVTIVDNRFTDNIQYGIDPHDFTTDLLIADNRVTGSRLNHGIAASRGVAHGHIINNTVIGNNNGIMLDRYTTDMVVANNRVRRNSQAGIALYESQAALVHNNTLINNTQQALVARNSWKIGVFNNTIEDTGIKASARSRWDGTRDLARDPYRPFASLSLGGNSFDANNEVIRTTGPVIVGLHHRSQDWPLISTSYMNIPLAQYDTGSALRITSPIESHVTAETEQIAWTTIRRAISSDVGIRSPNATAVISAVQDQVLDALHRCS